LGIDSRLSIVLYVGMPRKLRLEYPGATYQVMSRGDQRGETFLDDSDRQDLPQDAGWKAWEGTGRRLFLPTR
jgi:hypothetical protein